MKCAHVRAREAEELDFRGLVIMPGVYLADVAAIFLDFLSLRITERGNVLREIMYFQRSKERTISAATMRAFGSPTHLA
jgi:hypothetical protein